MIRERMKVPKREETKNEGRKDLLLVLPISGGGVKIMDHVQMKKRVWCFDPAAALHSN
jgi:hypothetical protein